MIQESFEWKQAIKRNNAYVRRFGRSALADDVGYLLDRVQIRIVTNALFARRLLETPKVATALRDSDVSIVSHPWIGENVDYFNDHRLDAKYQLKNGLPKKLRGGILCDQVIHSFVWAWITGEGDSDLVGFVVSSDRKKHSELYMVRLEDWFGFTHAVANSNPSSISGSRSLETKQWQFKSK